MSRRPSKLNIELKVEYVQVPEERLGDWHAGISQLLQLLYAERQYYEIEVADERRDIDCYHDDNFVFAIDGLAFIEDRVFQEDA